MLHETKGGVASCIQIQKGCAVSFKRRSIHGFQYLLLLKKQQWKGDVRTDYFCVSVTQLHSGGWLHVLSEYQRAVVKNVEFYL